ncbi:hypothetical protein D3C85_1535230 [compost metagenome]
MPTHRAEICRRPLSSTRMDVLNPLPSSPPSRALAGTRQLSNTTSLVRAPAWPIFLSGLPMIRPGVPASTRKHEIELARRSGAVRAMTENRPAMGALVM